MKNIFFSLSFAIISTFQLVSAQNGFIDPDEILIGDKQLPEVLLVGSWHFNYPGLDAHKSEETDRINIYSDRRQKELSKLLDYLAKFKPTKILVESGPITGYLKYNYNQYKLGKEELRASESSQIGMRLVDRFQLDTIYGINAWSLAWELSTKKDTLKPKTYTDSIMDRHYFGGEDSISKKYSELYAYHDKLNVEHTLLENFKNINKRKNLYRGFGAYIAGGQFESDEYEGADALSMFWINRNLRIFRNITQNIDYNPDDRILVLMGSGHISILRWFFECTPEFNLVEFEDLEDF